MDGDIQLNQIDHNLCGNHSDFMRLNVVKIYYYNSKGMVSRSVQFQIPVSYAHSRFYVQFPMVYSLQQVTTITGTAHYFCILNEIRWTDSVGDNITSVLWQWVGFGCLGMVSQLRPLFSMIYLVKKLFLAWTFREILGSHTLIVFIKV